MTTSAPARSRRARSRWLVLLVAVLALVVGSASWFGASTAHAVDGSFTLPSLDTIAVLRADGSMDVTEHITYTFSGGPFHFGERSFQTRLSDVHDFAASDADGPLQVIAPDRSESGNWEWQMRTGVSDQTIAFTLTYTVANAVTVGSDVADLNWKFIGDDHPGVGSMRVDVQLPSPVPSASADVADTDTSVLRGFAHGPSNGVVTVSADGVVATVDDVPARQFVELRVVAPAGIFTGVAAGTAPRLAGILAQERSLIGQQHDLADRHRLGNVMAPILALIALLGTFVTWMLFGRELKSTVVLGEYWREPLEDPPAVAVTNLKRGTVPMGPSFAGTVVDLAQRGYLRIVGVKEHHLVRDTTEHHYQWAGKALGPDVLPFEQQVLEFVFQGKTETTSSELRDWAKHHQREASGKLDKVKASISGDYTRRGWEATGNNRARIVLLVLCVATGAGSWALRSWTHNGIMWVGVVASVAALVVGLGLLKNRTEAGADAAAKAAGLKKFLHDFSRLEDAPIGHLILWERYLVDAVALGVSAELLRGLEVRMPALIADPGFAAWYVMPPGSMGRFDGFDHVQSFGSSVVSASTPNNSGSGGGFSGGSSGGGGGGGFGAH